jgi:anaerobic magnesium-protoporphyrin IX monomethyl ester cyclase
MDSLDVLFIGAVMNYDGTVGSHANYVRDDDGRWIAPFQFVYRKRPERFPSEADACVYSLPNLSISKLVDYLRRRMDLSYHIVWHFDYHKEEIEAILQDRPPKLVAISSTLAFYPQFLNDAVRWINERKRPETKVVVGGKWIFDRYKAFQPSRALEAVFVQNGADYYVINGYGEETLYQLLLAERAGDVARAQSLPNLAYRTRDAVAGASGSKCEYVGRYYQVNASELENQTPGNPMIDFENVGQQFLAKTVHVRAAVSCPFKCSFCTFPVLQGEHETFDNDAVIAQLRQLKAMGVDSLYFIDDTFNVPKRRFDDLMDKMIAAKLGMTWVSFFRAQYADAEIVRKMYEAGCRLVFCGFESGNDEILKKMNKHVTVKQYVQGLDYLERNGIYVLASYIVGYPGETYRTAMDTLQLMNHPWVSFSRGGMFYYETNAPIARLAGQWQLVGSGAEWSHHTMDSKEAAALHLEMIDKLEQVNIPISDGGGWNNFHLFARGIDFPQQRELFREFGAIQKAQIQSAGRGAVEQYRAFATARKPRGTAVAPDPVAGAFPAMEF